jgi:uncharacterized protein YjbI with pentapeptide repeats
MSRARLNDSDLAYANLLGADLRDCELGGAILGGAKLPPMIAEAMASMATSDPR